MVGMEILSHVQEFQTTFWEWNKTGSRQSQILGLSRDQEEDGHEYSGCYFSQIFSGKTGRWEMAFGNADHGTQNIQNLEHCIGLDSTSLVLTKYCFLLSQIWPGPIFVSSTSSTTAPITPGSTPTAICNWKNTSNSSANICLKNPEMRHMRKVIWI